MRNAMELREVLSACSLPEAIEILTKDALEELGWTVHTDRPTFIGAVKEGARGQLMELRVDRQRGSIAGALSGPGRAQHSPRMRRIFGLPVPMMTDPEPQVHVRRLVPVGASEIIAAL